jgi:hypothetical protein
MRSLLEEAQAELGVTRRALQLRERAYADGRVVDEEMWMLSMARQRDRIAELEADVELLQKFEEAA